MTKDQITHIAREAGFVGMDGDHGALRRFASLVAQQEREKCARVCEETSSDMNPMAHWSANECARLIRGMETQ